MKYRIGYRYLPNADNGELRYSKDAVHDAERKYKYFEGGRGWRNRLYGGAPHFSYGISDAYVYANRQSAIGALRNLDVNRSAFIKEDEMFIQSVGGEKIEVFEPTCPRHTNYLDCGPEMDQMWGRL